MLQIRVFFINFIDRYLERIQPEALARSRQALQSSLNTKVEEKRVLDTIRLNALASLTECQRLVEDLEERETLEHYAKSNGLTLELGTTDELIQICRTHQEKIALKNAQADEVCGNNTTISKTTDAPVFKAPSRFSSRSTSSSFTKPRRVRKNRKARSSYSSSKDSRSSKDYTRRGNNSKGKINNEETNLSCDCSECRRNVKNGSVSCSTCRNRTNDNYTQDNSSMYFQKHSEAQRKQDGLTVAGAINQR